MIKKIYVTCIVNMMIALAFGCGNNTSSDSTSIDEQQNLAILPDALTETNVETSTEKSVETENIIEEQVNTPAFLSGTSINTNSNYSNGIDMVSDGSFLYWPSFNSVYKADADGTNVIKLYEVDEDGAISNIDIGSDGYIYFNFISLDSDSICRVDKSGNGFKKIYLEDGYQNYSMRVIEDGILIKNGVLLDFEGNEVDRIYGRYASPACTLNITDGYIYFFDNANGESINKLSKDGLRFEKIYEGFVKHMVIDENGEWLYFTDFYEGDNLFKMNTEGGSVQKLCDFKTQSINVSGNWLYFVGEESGNGYKIYKMDIEGNDIQEVLDVFADGLSIYNGNIYYKLHGDSQSGIIYRYSIDGGVQTVFFAPDEE